MLGYYRKPEETKACYTADGWLRTGDSGMWLEDGYFRFLGRDKDMLKIGGENVDPMETEGLPLEHSAIYQIAVVGVPDETFGEVAVAYVQRAPGAAIHVDEVIACCRSKIASFKIPAPCGLRRRLPDDGDGQDPQIRASRRRQTAICWPAASSDGIDAYDFGCLIEQWQTERSTFRSGAMKFDAMVVPRASDWRLVVEVEQMGYDTRGNSPMHP